MNLNNKTYDDLKKITDKLSIGDEICVDYRIIPNNEDSTRCRKNFFYQGYKIEKVIIKLIPKFGWCKDDRNIEYEHIASNFIVRNQQFKLEDIVNIKKPWF